MMKNNTPPSEKDRPMSVSFTETMLRVTLKDGREIATPLAWYPRLLNATPEQRNAYSLSLSGVHWQGIDEDLSVLGMLRGKPSGEIFDKKRTVEE